MKNTFVLIGLMLLAVAGFSQMSKADAVAFLARNPIEKTAGVIVWDGSDKTEWAKETVVSFKAMESGFSFIVTQSGVDREKFYPFASIKLISINSANQLNIVLRG